MFPISAFVAAGFEHSIANLYFIPLGMLLSDAVTWSGLVSNLVPVTLGNIFGGSVLVALVYYLIYRRPALASPRSGAERTRADDEGGETASPPPQKAA